jgi:hypothetical protein
MISSPALKERKTQSGNLMRIQSSVLLAEAGIHAGLDLQLYCTRNPDLKAVLDWFV